MSLKNVQSGDSLPDEFNVIIEIPMNSDPVKYEVDKETGAVTVDRFMLTAMYYPYNYGYIPKTLSPDGDPVDVLVKTPHPLQVGSVIKCRPLGVLKMEDESGLDAKLLAVPVTKLYPPYAKFNDINDLPEQDLIQIKHFFEHYKDLEKGKWVKVTGFERLEGAKKEIIEAQKSYKE
ncbi:inorganic diphosphatase [Taylorella equigenitalis]|uniref:Inorganic pyrophosphatase n=1 Tax=Taylorella equigenitalis ATCC 35865 TaxID=743973 RepID=A0ABN4AVT6_9BURK|nr:inorganic diphosphatase [Taylorella equigenitalis]AFN36001.1 inorganic pyrophophatase [Taylorella equigenitalis ATCC 35865]ASY39415.1 inorganic pyrophosphatase [Taylorella equigenitalis]VEG31550.1 Inorganic pyrophosphatase [Taylorella equigenitalis ATCC 35865]